MPALPDWPDRDVQTRFSPAAIPQPAPPPDTGPTVQWPTPRRSRRALLAGVLLGPGGGALSQGVYVALGLVGLPIFTAGGGFGYVLQPSFGFLLGLIPAAAVIGGLSRRSSPVRLALACGAGLAVLYAVGVPYMALILNGYLGKGISAPALLWSGMLIYLPGDAAKIAVTALLCPVLRRRIPGLR